MRRRLVGALFAMLGLMFWANTTAAAMPAGTVVAVGGSCTAGGRALVPGSAVQVGDTIDVPPRNKLKLRMVDGSVISIAPGSFMTVEQYNVGGAARDVKLWLTQGLLRAVVDTVAGPSAFEVSTAVGTASVGSASADWFVKAEPGSAQVGVLAGEVDLTSAATRHSVSIPGRWGTRLETGRDPVPPRNWTEAEFDAVTDSTQ